MNIQKKHYNKPLVTQLGQINKLTQKNKNASNLDHATQDHRS